jgi:hypothetical protein
VHGLIAVPIMVGKQFDRTVAFGASQAGREGGAVSWLYRIAISSDAAAWVTATSWRSSARTVALAHCP